MVGSAVLKKWMHDDHSHHLQGPLLLDNHHVLVVESLNHLNPHAWWSNHVLINVFDGEIILYKSEWLVTVIILLSSEIRIFAG